MMNPTHWIKYDIDIEDTEEYTLTFLYDFSLYGTDLVEPEIILTLDSLQREKQGEKKLFATTVNKNGFFE